MGSYGRYDCMNKFRQPVKLTQVGTRVGINQYEYTNTKIVRTSMITCDMLSLISLSTNKIQFVTRIILSKVMIESFFLQKKL